jgi:pimeloyl-ACP methyl ester carboxylesterase
MKTGLLPLVERAGRFALNRRGFESRTVSTRTALVHVYEAAGYGTLPTTAVLHGIGSGATSFAATLVRLRPHVRRVIAPDLPAHGFSGSPSVRLTSQALFDSVREVLDRSVPEPMVLVGNSLGGALAIEYAMASPERVRALVLASPAGARVDPAEWEALLRAFKIDSTAEARRMLRRLYHRTPWYISALGKSFRDVMRRPGIREILENARLDDLPTPERLRRLSMPVLLLWGRSERVLPASSLEYFRRCLPDHAIVEETTGFGHCPHFDDPARLAARVVDFARSAGG